MIDAAALDLGDYFEFQVEQIGEVHEGFGRGVRFRADALVAGRLFEQLAIDLGFVDSLPHDPDELDVPNLLDFAEIPGMRVPAAPLEQHLAEKFHAYTRFYGDGHGSSRPKDLIDMVLISELAAFDAGRLREIIQRDFNERGTHTVPTTLPSPPTDWARRYRTLAEEVHVEPEPSAGHAHVADLLNPLVGDESFSGRWVPAAQSWETS